MTGDAERLGLYGFGASAHIVAQVARHQGRRVFAFTKPGDGEGQAFARELGAEWAGGSDERPPEELDAAIVFAPGRRRSSPLRSPSLAKGGSVVCAGIHMSDIPRFPYELLWGERAVRSVANLTRADGDEFLALAPQVPVRVEVETFPLADANEALDRLRAGRIRGARCFRRIAPGKPVAGPSTLRTRARSAPRTPPALPRPSATTPTRFPPSAVKTRSPEPVGDHLAGLAEGLEPLPVRALQRGDGRAGADPLAGLQRPVPGRDHDHALRALAEVDLDLLPAGDEALVAVFEPVDADRLLEQRLSPSHCVIPSLIPTMEPGVTSIAFCADARGAAEKTAKTRTIAMRRIPWRSVLLWALPALAFAWLAVAERV